MNTPVITSKCGKPIGSDHLMSIKDVSELLGVCPLIASKIIAETGHKIVLHRKVFVRESALVAYLDEVEGQCKTN